MKSLRDKETFVRLQAVLLVAQGRAIKEAAAVAGKTVQSVYAWIKVYVQHHLPQDLSNRPRSGRPPVGTAISSEAILEALNEPPQRLGYRQTTWTVALLAHYLSACYQSPVSERTLRRRMKALGLRYKRPRYLYSEKDPARAQKKGPSFES